MFIMNKPTYTKMTRRMRKTQPYGKHPVWKYNSKLDSRKLAEKAGIPAPKIFDFKDSIDDLSKPTHPCVLKPNNGSGGKSVFLIRPREDGAYDEVHTGEILTWDEIKTRATAPRRKRINRDNVEPPWILEELLLDKHGVPVCGWNLWCFGGEPAVISQTVQRVPGGTYKRRWYDTDWNDIGDIRPRPGVMEYTPSLEPPTRPQELLQAARDVAVHVSASFIRVDLYDLATGPVFGEITPWPGGSTPFVPEWEQKMGYLWAKAERVV